MLKRVLLALTIVAALGVAGVGIADTAEARGCHRGGYGGYYGGYAPHAAYYSPRVVYYGHGGHWGRGYYGYGPRYHRPGGVYFSIGF